MCGGTCTFKHANERHDGRGGGGWGLSLELLSGRLLLLPLLLLKLRPLGVPGSAADLRTFRAAVLGSVGICGIPLHPPPPKPGRARLQARPRASAGPDGAAAALLADLIKEAVCAGRSAQRNAPLAALVLTGIVSPATRPRAERQRPGRTGAPLPEDAGFALHIWTVKASSILSF